MISVMVISRLGLLAVLAAGALASGCGSGASASSSPETHAPTAPSPGGGPAGRPPGPHAPAIPAPGANGPSIPTPAPTGRPPDPAAVTVIRGWSSALLRGDAHGAAAYFARPSQFINGGGPGGVPVISIHTLRDAEAVDATLPCGAKFISADQRGRYVNALFRLTDRPGPGGGCGAGTGQLARTNFLIAHGHIVQWIRAPNDPGDNPGRPAPPGAPGAPGQPSPSAPGANPVA